MDIYFIILVIAALLNLVGFVWLVVVGFKRSVLWGILIFLFSPFSALVFAVTNWFDAKNSFLLYFVSTIALFVTGFLIVEEFGGMDRIEKVSAAVESGQIKQNEFFLYLDPNTLLPGEEDESEEEVGIDFDGDGVIDTPEAVISGDETTGTKTTGSESNAAKKGEVWVTDPNVEADSAEVANIGESNNDEELEVIIEEKKEALDYPTPGNITADPLVTPKKKKFQNGSVRVKLSKIKNYIGRYFIVTTKKGNQHRGILIKITKSRIILERKIYGGTFRYKVSKKRIKRLDMLKKEYIEDISG